MKKSSARIIPVLVITVLSFLVSAVAVFADTPQLTLERIDEVVTKLMKEKNIPGLSIAISMPGKTIEKSYEIGRASCRERV